MQLDDIPWQEARAKEYLLKHGGGKAGAYQYLCDTQPRLLHHLPTGTRYFEPGGDIEKFLDTVDFRKPKVVRGCHSSDITGMVDVIPTHLRVEGRDNVRFSIQRLLEDVQDPDVRSFIEYESGKPFDGKVGILVQDYCGGERGSIIEHPHERGLYRVARACPVMFGDTIKEEEVFEASGQALNLMKMAYEDNPERVYSDREAIAAEEVQKVIRLYRAIYDSGLMPHTHSFQMEYGVNNRTDEILFYQSRLFKPFEERGNFEPDYDVFEEGRTLPYLAVGITPKEGIEVQLAELDNEFIAKYREQEQMAYAYNNQTKSTDLDVQPHNLYAYLPYQHAVLAHGHYRWMQKAQVTLAGIRPFMAKGEHRKSWEPLQDIAEEIRLRITSNGIRAVVRVLK